MADGSPPEVKVVWKPLPGSQELLMACPCNHILYEGTRGPGKTDGQLMKFRSKVGMGYGKFWRGVIFDREYKNLDDLIAKSMRWFPEFGDGARFLSSKSDYRWVWPTGEELLFRQVKRLNDYWSYHGQEFPFIGWNELTKYPTSELYDMMMSCNRSSFLPEEHPIYEEGSSKPIFLPDIPLLVVSTTNPFGAGHNWVKRKFIDPVAPGQVQRHIVNVFNPRTQRREDVTTTSTRIFGSYKENKYLDPKYIAGLESMKNKNRRRAWLWGDWDIVAGGAIDDLWDETIHMRDRFRIPRSWTVNRSMDWGSTKPFSVGWWAEANGEEVRLPDGTLWAPPAGTLIRIFELYGSDEPGTNTGLKWTPSQVAKAVRDIDNMLLEQKWIGSEVQAGPADSQIFDHGGRTDVETVAQVMAKSDVYWTYSDKSAGSRISGLQLFRERLQASVDLEGPGVYFFRNCTTTRMLLPSMPTSEKNPDDVDTDSEDHLWDEVRYRTLDSSNRDATEIPTTLPR